MQPFASSTTFSSGQASTPQPLRISPSMPTSPNSLTMIASRLPPAFSRMLRISVVLPAPRKPVTTVQGMRDSDAVMMPFRSGLERDGFIPLQGFVFPRLRKSPRLFGIVREGRDARDEAALQAAGAAAPGQQPIRRRGEEPRAGDEVGRAVGGEIAEHVAPATVPQQCG